MPIWKRRPKLCFLVLPILGWIAWTQWRNLPHYAAHWGNIELLMFLRNLEGPGIVDRRWVTLMEYNRGMTPLGAAAFAGEVDAMRFLLGIGADPNAMTATNDRSILVLAMAGPRDAEALGVLLDAGANTSTFRNSNAIGLAHGWSRSDFQEVATILVENGVDINEPRVLRTAIQWGDLDQLRVLLELGADPALVDARGRSNLSYAESHFSHKPEIVELLREYAN